MCDVAALVADGRRAAIGSEVIEIAASRHVLRMVESRRRADRIFFELRKAVAATKIVGELDRLRRLFVRKHSAAGAGGEGLRGAARWGGAPAVA